MKDSSQPLLKGLFIGSACGLMAGWFGMSPLRALILGTIAGLLAGLTKKILSKRSDTRSGHLRD